MDIIITLLAAVLTPVFLGYSDIKYTPNAGIFISENTKMTIFSVNYIKGANDTTDQRVLKTQYSSPYLIDYEVFAENKIPVALNNKLWIGTRLSYAPLRYQITLQMKAPLSVNPKTSVFYFNEEPAFGAMIGYDFKAYDPSNSLGFSLSPYIGASFLRVGYESLASANQLLLHDSVIKYFAGLDMQMDNNWHLRFETSAYFLDVIGIDGLGQDLKVLVNKYKVGVSYYFENSDYIKRAKKDQTYDDIISTLDSNLDLRKKDAELERKIKEDKENEILEQTPNERTQNEEVSSTATLVTPATTTIPPTRRTQRPIPSRIQLEEPTPTVKTSNEEDEDSWGFKE